MKSSDTRKPSLRVLMQELLNLLADCDRDVELTKTKALEFKTRLLSPRTLSKIKLETLLVGTSIIKACDEL